MGCFFYYVLSCLASIKFSLRRTLVRSVILLCKIDYPKLGTFAIFEKTVLRVIAKSTLREFWQKHSDAEQQLSSWYQEANQSIWKNPNQIKKDYPSASFLADNRVVFNIKGNKYRLIVKINYDYGMVWIRFVGTHAEYDKIDAEKI